VNISAPFIHRPVATILLTVGVALCGAVAFMLLPVAPLPRIDVPAIFVSAALPGASLRSWRAPSPLPWSGIWAPSRTSMT
jgi:multidrug efflux pump subunit AcrB